MKQNTSAWGRPDVVFSGMQFCVPAFLPRGTLPELRRFLSDKGFREQFLQSVTNAEVVYFWEAEVSSNKTAVGSILTRLGLTVAVRIAPPYLGTAEELARFRRDHGFEENLPQEALQGLIGESNAYLLGSLLVSASPNHDCSAVAGPG